MRPIRSPWLRGTRCTCKCITLWLAASPFDWIMLSPSGFRLSRMAEAIRSVVTPRFSAVASSSPQTFGICALSDHLQDLAASELPKTDDELSVRKLCGTFPLCS
jgi:hypothetical protein